MVGEAAVAGIVTNNEQAHDRKRRQHAAEQLPAEAGAREDQVLADREEREVEAKERKGKRGRAVVVAREDFPEPDDAWRLRDGGGGRHRRRLELGGGLHGGRGSRR